MRINGFRCDACCKEQLLEATSFLTHSMGEMLPTDWFFVSHGKQGQEPFMFCSLRCLADWAFKQIEPKEVVPEEQTQTRENWW